MKLLMTLAALLVASTPALADHAVRNAGEIARAAYRAADDAEFLAEAAHRDIRGPFEDHRGDLLRDLARAADALHYSLSDLYRAARNADGPFEDHRGDRIREEFYGVRSDFDRLNYTWSGLSRWQVSHEVRRYYQSLQYTFSRLEYLVLGN